ncbi:hypothetical protein D3C72_1820870 [compost metagenome]
MAGGVVADRQAGEEYHQTHGEDRPQAVGEAVVEHQGGADRLQHQERQGAEGGVGDAPLRPFAKRLGCVAQGVVFPRLVGDPAVVVAADVDDALGSVGVHGGGFL